MFIPIKPPYPKNGKSKKVCKKLPSRYTILRQKPSCNSPVQRGITAVITPKNQIVKQRLFMHVICYRQLKTFALSTISPSSSFPLHSFSFSKSALLPCQPCPGDACFITHFFAEYVTTLKRAELYHRRKLVSVFSTCS